MDRRTFIFGVASGLALASPGATAQVPKRLLRIGYLTPSAFPNESLIAAFRDLGYAEGQSTKFEVRSAQNDFDRLPMLAAELVRIPVDILVAVSPPAIVAAKRATNTIPIVMAFWGGEGLIESGIVASFARPGGNVTGVYMLADELDAKRLELLLEAVPKARKVGMLNPGRGWNNGYLSMQLRQIAERHEAQLVVSEPPGPGGYNATFAALGKAKVDAVLVPSFPGFYRDHASIVMAAAAHGTPAIYEWGEIARAGGLMAYGPVIAELDRRVARYADKIIKGAKPGDLPIEQPTNFELVINLRTAKALRLTIPQSLLLRADEAIQ